MRRFVKPFILSMLVLLSGGRASAQLLQATRSHYSTDDGLTSNSITKIVQDDYGYIWLATWNGLSRFDGYEFYNYKTGPASHVPNLHNRIKEITVDNLQNIWMRMYDNRIFVLLRSIDTIVNPFEGISGNEEFRTSISPTVTSAGDVLVEIDGVGIYKFRVDRENVRTQLITTGNLTITSMAEGYMSDIWLGTDKGVHRMDASNLTVERKGYFLDEQINCLYSNGYNIFAGTESGKIVSFSYGQEPVELYALNMRITGLFVDSHNLIWFSDTRNGVSRYNPETGEEKHFEQRVLHPVYDSAGAEFNEVDGILWMMMNHGGYGYYDRENDEVLYFHNDPSNPWNLSNTVMARLELPEGVIWESTTRCGLEKLEIQKNTILRTILVPDATSNLENEIRAMFYDMKHKELFLGNKASQLFVYPQNGAPSVISHDDQGNSLGRLYGISQGADGTIWVSSKDKGLYRLTRKPGGGFSMQNYCNDPENPASLSSNSAYATVEDRTGNLWVATYGGGVNVLPRGKQEFLNYKNGLRNYPFNSHQKVRSVALDKEGNVWAGTTDGILIMHLNADGKVAVEPLQHSEEEPDAILMSNDVVCLAQDAMGSMWVGTNGGGLTHTIGKDGDGRWLFENFGSKDGLPSEEIRAITFDTHGNVWFSTDHALCSFNVEKHIFTSFSNLDGVDDTQCSEGAAVNIPGGDILFGTINGYYTVDRNKLVNSVGNMLKLRFTDFWVDDELQSPRLNDNYDFYVPEAHEVVLPSHNSVFAIRFASLNYQLQHRVHYQYMVEGLDADWRNSDRDRTVTISNLPTGTYRFKVRAMLLESPEKADVRAITIVVPPYFLLSKNAIWLYMAVVAAILLWVLFGLQYRLERKYGVVRVKPEKVKPQPVAEQQQEETDAYEVIED